jgi:hypothetical protein
MTCLHFCPATSLFPRSPRRTIVATFSYDVKIARVQRTLQHLEDDVPLLAMRVRELSPERQVSAKRFAASMIDHTRAELDRLVLERYQEPEDPDPPCEPAD